MMSLLSENQKDVILFKFFMNDFLMMDFKKRIEMLHQHLIF